MKSLKEIIMRNKIISILIVMTLAVLLFSGCSSAGSNVLISEKNISAFDSVHVMTSSTRIEFVTSDNYGLEIFVPGRLSPEWDVTNGHLTIFAKKRVISFGPSALLNSYVKVYYPKGAVFHDISLKASSGSIEVPQVAVSDLNLSTSSGKIAASVENCETIDATTSSGSVTLSGSGDSATALTVNTTSGSIRADGAVWRDVRTKTHSGSTEISGDLLGNTDVKTSSGNVKLSVSSDPSAYGYSLTPNSGSIHWDGVKMGKPARSSGSFENNIAVDTSSGSIRVDFNKPK